MGLPSPPACHSCIAAFGGCTLQQEETWHRVCPRWKKGKAGRQILTLNVLQGNKTIHCLLLGAYGKTIV